MAYNCIILYRSYLSVKAEGFLALLLALFCRQLEPNMHIILNAHSSNEHFNGDCDYAVVELTPALAEQIRNRVALARQAAEQDSDLYEVYFWGSSAEFFDHDILDACQNAVAAAGGPDPDQAACDWLAEFELQEYAVVPDGVDFAVLEPKRTETDQMIVRCSPSSHRPEFKIAWMASPKHSDVYVNTCELPLRAVVELLAAASQSQ